MGKDTSPFCTGDVVSSPGHPCPGRVKRAVYVLAPATPNDPTMRFRRGRPADTDDGDLKACTHCFRVYRVTQPKEDAVRDDAPVDAERGA